MEDNSGGVKRGGGGGGKRKKGGGGGGGGDDGRTVLLCFDASREGFLWLSRYVCFPFLLAVLGTSLLTTWRYVLAEWPVFEDELLLLSAIGLHALALFLVYLLFKTSLTSPGYVPHDWEPSAEQLEKGGFVEPTSREFSSPNWCAKCQSHRPKRAHHCRYCQRCVLVFDHHCPWVNNCVGWGNMKCFMLLLFYASGYSVMVCLAWMVRCYQVIWMAPESAAVSTKLTMVGLLMTWCSFAFAICGFAQHMMVQIVYLTPSCEKFHLTNRIRKTMSMPRPERLAFLRENIELVFGRLAALWYVPTLPDSDPYNYPSFTDTFFLEEEEQPPQENDLVDRLTQLENERRDSLHVLRQYRAEDRTSEAEAEDEWGKAKEVLATSEQSVAFDPSRFYGQLPRKGG